jgi:hypothetical protein
MELAQKICTATPPLPRDVCLRAVNLDPLKRFQERQRVASKAQARPLPGSSGKAFTSGPIRVGNVTVQRVVPAHFAILQALESPILKMIEDATQKDGEKKSEANFKAHQIWDACYVFTSDPQALYDALESKGASYISEQAKMAVGVNPDFPSTNLVMMAVIEQIKSHVETTVRFAAELKDSGQTSFFREQPETN